VSDGGGEGKYRCWYCGDAVENLTDEHVLSEAHFGARLISVSSVCEPCNRAAGEVERMVAEHPFVSEAIAEFRTGTASRRRPYPRHKGILSDGSNVLVEQRAGGSRVVSFVPRLLRTDPDGVDVWEVAHKDAEAFVKRRKQDGTRVRVVARDLASSRPREIHYGIGARNFDAWPRFVAKVTLAVGSLALPNAWLDGSDAKNLQDAFHQRPAPGLPLYPLEADQGEPPWSLLRPHHLLTIRRHPDAAASCLIVLFGYLAAEIPLPDTRCPAEEPCWIVPSDRRKPTKTGIDEAENVLREIRSSASQD
jgi:hypothetical protein